MSITTVKTRLAQIVAATTGIHRAYAEGPRSLAGPDLPTAVIFAGPSTMERDGDKNWIEHRTYFIRVYVWPIQTGLDGAAEAARDALLCPVRDMLMAHPGLGLGGILDPADFDPETDGPLQGVWRTVYTGDQPAIFPYSTDAGANYIGTEHHVLVDEIVKPTRAKFE